MQSPKEIFLELLKPDGKPERQLKQYEAIQMMAGDPVSRYVSNGLRPGVTVKDMWGITRAWPEGVPGAIPVHGNGLTVCTDLTRWQETVHAPDIASVCADSPFWASLRQKHAERANGEKLLTAFMPTGIFEECHYLMGFEDTLTAFYEHPDELHALIDYITEFRLTYARLLIDGLQPDAILSHDDWGAKDALFMKPEMWREFFKEPYRRLYSYIRSRGVIVIHHADSYLAPIVDDMAEIGIQVWQGVLPENDIPALQAHLQGKLVLMGGFGAAIDRADSTAEEIRSYALDTMRRCCPGGHFIPCITYGLPGTVFKHADVALDAAVDEYNASLHLPRVPLAPLPRRGQAAAAAVTVQAAQERPAATTLEKLSLALYKGQQKKVLALCEQAIQEGTAPNAILNEGLLPGMNTLGEDFSANKVFVPEMLVAARCMEAATTYLKPYLVSGGNETIGRVCLGTVKGDMHDIGKNLVKIMMEGSGLEVIDLGSDVDPEAFISAAKTYNCRIIACSALLTTTMEQMRRVVALAEEAGIRQDVKIMVGGAPISQSFCDEIGADAYTRDASEAARVAVSLLTA